MFLGCRNEREIRLELEQKNVSLSPSEIAYLTEKFIAYLALAHRESRERIRNFMNLQGGYVLHLDATCEGESPHLMSGLDGITEIHVLWFTVWVQVFWVPSERSSRIYQNASAIFISCATSEKTSLAKKMIGSEHACESMVSRGCCVGEPENSRRLLTGIQPLLNPSEQA